MTNGTSTAASQPFWKSPVQRKIAFTVIAIVASLLILRLGMFIGHVQAALSLRAGETYFRAIDGSDTRNTLLFVSNDMPTAHGAVGRVMSVSLPTFVVASPDNVEKTVVVSTGTQVRRFRDVVPATDIRQNDFTVVLGNPDAAGRIQADLVRIMPTPALYSDAPDQTANTFFIQR